MNLAAHFQTYDNSIFESRAQRFQMRVQPKVVIDNVDADVYIVRNECPTGSNEVIVVFMGPSDTYNPLANRLLLEDNTLSLVVEPSYEPTISDPNSRVRITLYVPKHTQFDIKNVIGHIHVGNVDSSFTLAVMPMQYVEMGRVSRVDLDMAEGSDVLIGRVSVSLKANLEECADLTVCEVSTDNVDLSVSFMASAQVLTGFSEKVQLTSDCGDVGFYANSNTATLSANFYGRIEIKFEGDENNITQTVTNNGEIVVKKTD